MWYQSVIPCLSCDLIGCNLHSKRIVEKESDWLLRLQILWLDIEKSGTAHNAGCFDI